MESQMSRIAILKNYFQQNDIKLSSKAHTIYRLLTDILFVSPLEIAQSLATNFLNQHDIQLVWIQRSVELNKFLENLLVSNQLDKNTVFKIVGSLIDFVESRDYQVVGRYEKSSWLGFSLVRVTQPFDHFVKSLRSFGDNLRPSQISTDVQTISQSSMLRNTLAALKNLYNEPVKSCLLMLCFSNVLTLANAANNDQDLVADYPFSANTNDESGYSKNPAVVFGAKFAPDRFGVMNHALYFDGNSYVTSPSTSFPQGERTAEIWVNPDENGGGGILGYGGSAAIRGASFNLITNNVCAKYSLQVETYNEANHLGYTDKELTIPASAWTLLTITTSPKLGTNIYLNGTLAASAVTSIDNTFTHGDLFALGAIADDSGNVPNTNDCVSHFKGSLDDFKMFRRALSSDEVLQSFKDSSVRTKVESPWLVTKAVIGAAGLLESCIWETTIGSVLGTVGMFAVMRRLRNEPVATTADALRPKIPTGGAQVG
jgi:hypothetical protein